MDFKWNTEVQFPGVNLERGNHHSSHLKAKGETYVGAPRALTGDCDSICLVICGHRTDDYAMRVICESNRVSR